MKQEPDPQRSERDHAVTREQQDDAAQETPSSASRIPGLSDLPDRRPPRRAFGLLRGRRKT